MLNKVGMLSSILERLSARTCPCKSTHIGKDSLHNIKKSTPERVMFVCCRWTCVHSASVSVAPVRALRGLALGSPHGREVCLILCGRSERAGCLRVALPQLQWASALSQC